MLSKIHLFSSCMVVRKLVVFRQDIIRRRASSLDKNSLLPDDEQVVVERWIGFFLFLLKPGDEPEIWKFNQSSSYKLAEKINNV